MALLNSTIITGTLRVTDTIYEGDTSLVDKYALKSHTHITLPNRLALNPGSDSFVNSYNEGIRINQATNGWAEIALGGANNSTNGIAAGMWIVGRRGAAGSVAGAVGDFSIEHNGSNGTGLTLYADGSRPRWNNKGLAYTTDIPTVNNAKLTIQRNGSTIQTFTANASSDVTANITVPTVIADIGGWSSIGTVTAGTSAITTTITSASSTNIVTEGGIKTYVDNHTGLDKAALKVALNQAITVTANSSGSNTLVININAITQYTLHIDP